MGKPPAHLTQAAPVTDTTSAPPLRTARLFEPAASPPTEPAGVLVTLGPGPGARRWLWVAATVALVASVAAGTTWWARDRSTATSPPAGLVRGPSLGTWAPLPPAPIERRAFPVAAWTGAQLVVWAGSNGSRSFAFTDGAAYDPATGTWRDLAVPGWGHPGLTSAFFDGRLYALAKGGGTRFDPSSGTWADLPQVEGMFLAGTVASDDAVWGVGPASGDPFGRTEVAVARYDPSTDAWVRRPTFAGTPATGPLFGSPSGDRSTTVWTGTEILVWATGGGGPAFDPAASRWRVLPAPVPPEGRVARSLPVVSERGLVALVEVSAPTGTEVRLAVARDGGWAWPAGPLGLTTLEGVTAVAAGGAIVLFSPASVPVVVDLDRGTWSLEAGAPVGRVLAPAAVWTGRQLLVWGGEVPDGAPAAAAQGAVWTTPAA